MTRQIVIMSLILLGFARIASSQSLNWSVKLEPGLAIPLTEPQSHLFGVGGAITAKAFFGWSRIPYLDAGPTVGFLGLPASGTNLFSKDTGVGWQVGAGFRLKKPIEDELYTLTPWADMDFLYVRTGSLDRFGFSIGAGVSLPIGEKKRYWVGPFLRYFQTVQGDRLNFDNHDAKILIVGVSFEIGHEYKKLASKVVTAPCAAVVQCPPIVKLPDRDGDGVPDIYDRCPDVPGLIKNYGCPPYKKICVKKGRLELKERIQFEWDKANLESASFPVLNEAVIALKDNKNWKVQVEGYASSEGVDEHNQKLSEQRAKAVVDYLVMNGISRDRLKARGFGSTFPINTNDTDAGRVLNRRVEFSIHLIVINDEEDK